ncbi:transposable element Tc3 transposase [Trichonephila clavipes]|nr:transposable element Tc3 transposase [Trichonephila clavipes]
MGTLSSSRRGKCVTLFGGVRGTPRNSSSCKQQQGRYTNYCCNPYGKAALHQLKLTRALHYHQENTIERHRYNGAGWLVWGGIILGSRTDLHVQSVTMTGHIYRDVILEQHASLLRGAMGAEFPFMDDNARPHRANIVNEFLQSKDITSMDWPEYSPDVYPIDHVWDMLGR